MIKKDILKEYYENGNVKNGPAYISYYDNGNVEKEIYYKHNKLHNLNGPAYVEYMNNEIFYKEYYINNTQYDELQYLIKITLII